MYECINTCALSFITIDGKYLCYKCKRMAPTSNWMKKEEEEDEARKRHSNQPKRNDIWPIGFTVGFLVLSTHTQMHKTHLHLTYTQGNVQIGIGTIAILRSMNIYIKYIFG